VMAPPVIALLLAMASHDPAGPRAAASGSQPLT
jgi:hypothetical protein